MFVDDCVAFTQGARIIGLNIWIIWKLNFVNSALSINGLIWMSADRCLDQSDSPLKINDKNAITILRRQCDTMDRLEFFFCSNSKLNYHHLIDVDVCVRVPVAIYTTVECTAIFILTIVANIGLPHRRAPLQGHKHIAGQVNKNLLHWRTPYYICRLYDLFCVFLLGLLLAVVCLFGVLFSLFYSVVRFSFLALISLVSCVRVCVCVGCCRFQHFRFHKKSAHTHYRVRLCVSATQITNIRWAQPQRTSLIQNIARVGLNHTKVTNCASTTFSLSNRKFLFLLFPPTNSVQFLWQKIGELLFEKWQIWCFNTNPVIFGKCHSIFSMIFFVFFELLWIDLERWNRVETTVVRWKRRKSTTKKLKLQLFAFNTQQQKKCHRIRNFAFRTFGFGFWTVNTTVATTKRATLLLENRVFKTIDNFDSTFCVTTRDRR